MSIIENKQHARLSPSASKRWMTCPGSIGLTEQLNIEDKPSKFAAEGTVAHEIHEKCLLEGNAAKYYLGKTFTADGFKFTVTQGMVDAVQESLDYINGRIEDATEMDMTVRLEVEVRSSLEYLNIPGLDGGTSDVVLLFFAEDEDGHEYLDEIEVIDYKHGAGVAVEAKDNTQALCYGLGVMRLPQFNTDHIPSGITITITQPRAHHPDGPIRSWNISQNQLAAWEQYELEPKAKACHEPDAEFKPSDDGCRFCPCAGQCPKLYERTQEVALADFADDSFPDPVTMSVEQKSLVMDHAAMLRAFIVAVEDQIKQEVDAGSKDYEGRYKLVRKTTRRKFVGEALDPVMSPLLDHLSEEDIFEQKSRSMTEIEKRLKNAIGNKHAKEIMDDITEKPEGGLVIAPESDKRKAVQPSVIGDFNNLDD